MEKWKNGSTVAPGCKIGLIRCSVTNELRQHKKVEICKKMYIKSDEAMD